MEGLRKRERVIRCGRSAKKRVQRKLRDKEGEREFLIFYMNDIFSIPGLFLW